MSTSIDERLFEAAIGTLELFSVFIGRELDLYERLEQPATVAEFAENAGIDERYAREWLEQQATAGFLAVDDVSARWSERRYSLDHEIAPALLDGADPLYVSPLAHMVTGIAQVIDKVVDAYRTGEGVAYELYGRHFRHGQGEINRPAFTNDLVDAWIPAMPDVAARLETGGRIADLGCGVGYSTIAMTKRYPGSAVVGIDVDKGSIEDAREIAAGAGVDATFVCADASLLTQHGPFDLVTMLECLHDLSAPVEVLRSVHSSLAPGGVVLVADEAVAAGFTAPGDDIERFMYGWSVSHCLPAAMAETPSAAIGTVIRPDHVAALASEAGFSSVSRVDADGGFFNLYRLEA